MLFLIFQKDKFTYKKKKFEKNHHKNNNKATKKSLSKTLKIINFKYFLCICVCWFHLGSYFLSCNKLIIKFLLIMLNLISYLSLDLKNLIYKYFTL